MLPMSPEPQLPLSIIEQLMAKLCHDLISPVSAVNNGIELLSSIGSEVLEDVLPLIGQGAQQSASKLKLFRYAFGMAGQALPVSECKPILKQLTDSHKAVLEWPAEITLQGIGLGKILINLSLLGIESIIEPQQITLHQENETVLALMITGKAARVPPSVPLALADSLLPDMLDGYAAQAQFAYQLCQRANLKIDLVTTEQSMMFMLQAKAQPSTAPVFEANNNTAKIMPAPTLKIKKNWFG